MFRNSKLFVIIVTMLTFVMLFGCGGPNTADLVLLNGKIVTVDEEMPEAEALAVHGDRILAVGSKNEIQPYITESTKTIDLNGKLALPGFIDAHGHFTSLGHAMMKLDLMHVENWSEIVSMVEEAVKEAEPGEWILGRGWHQEKWDRTPQPNVDGLPFHHELSEVSPNNPVLLTHASGHSCIANAKAMELAEITKETSAPEGGEIVRDQDGNPIGVFRETAQRLISKARNQSQEERTPEQVKEKQKEAILLAQKECFSNGVTSFHDAGSSFGTIDLFKEMIKNDELKVRMNVMVSEGNKQLKEHLSGYRMIGAANYHLTVRSIKRLIDGALGSHGAWFLEPYNDLPSSTGLNTCPIDVMKETAKIAIENDFQLCTHAIGDRANRKTLDIYEQAFKNHPDKDDLRWRIEHAQHIHPQDIPRFAELGVIASMQTVHCTSDGPYVIKRLGKERAKQGAYVWQKLMDSGAVICNGTDCPVEDIDPITNFHAAVTRELSDGTVFYPDQCMIREEALKSYTLNGAYAAFEEDVKGSLTPGKLADITVLSQDIMTIPEDKIPSTEVLYTIIGGEVVYKKEK